MAAAAKRRRHFVAALCLAVPAVLLSVVEVSLPLEQRAEARTARHALQTAFFGYMALVILLDVGRQRRVTAEKIRGAVCVFLLMGATWAFAYLTLLQLDPRALAFPFSKGDVPPTPWIGDTLYFSFVTLTTVGYGDIVPVSPLARSMAWLEASMGQLFMVLLVARLVGLHIAQSDSAD